MSTQETSEKHLNFFERMKSEVDFDKEYRKIEALMDRPVEYDVSITKLINSEFLNWKWRDTYISYDELRADLEFDSKFLDYTCRVDTLEKYLVYCEMIVNLVLFVDREYKEVKYFARNKAIIDNILRNLDKLGMRFLKMEDGRQIIVQNDAAANSVADIVPTDIGKAVLEYNHHLLKRNLKRKREILKVLADDLEAKRPALKATKFADEANLFFLFNSMNIRHNNSDPDSKAYNSKLSTITEVQLESIYDDTYQMALLAYLFLDDVERQKRINALK